MTIHEHQRSSLHQALENTRGPDAAATLMTLLPPVGWADVATKADLGVLRADLDALEQRMDHRLTAGLADVRTEIHKTAKTMTLTIVGATAAIVGTTATVLGAIAAFTGLFG